MAVSHSLCVAVTLFLTMLVGAGGNAGAQAVIKAISMISSGHTPSNRLVAVENSNTQSCLNFEFKYAVLHGFEFKYIVLHGFEFKYIVLHGFEFKYIVPHGFEFKYIVLHEFDCKRDSYMSSDSKTQSCMNGTYI
jgi:hypothetical protein